MPGTKKDKIQPGVVINAKIRTKILTMVVLICAFSLAGMSLAAYFTFRRVTGYSAQINRTLGEDATDGAGEALLKQAHYFLTSIAHEQSRNCSSILDDIKLTTLLLDGVVQDIFNNPGFYTQRRPITMLSDSEPGDFMASYFLVGEKAMTPEIEREIDLISNLSVLMPTLTGNPNIIGLYVGLESGLFYNYAPLSEYNPEYDHRQRLWYITARENSGDVIFTEAYEDALGTGMVITAAKAVHDKDGNFLGVAAVDIQLEGLKELILSVRVTNSGYAFIMDNTGRFIVHPDMSDEDFEPYPLKSQYGLNVRFGDGYRQMLFGNEGFVSEIVDGKKYFMTFSPVSVAGWSVGVIVPEEEILSALRSLTEQMEVLTDRSQADISEMYESVRLVFLGIFIVVIVMVTLLASRLTNLISKPIQNLTTEVSKIGDGNFEYRIPIETQDEIGYLTQAFNNMADNLYTYAQNILKLNNLKSELEVAAYTDGLTGVFNRRYFMEFALTQISEAHHRTFIAIFDIDHFKKVNDTYGHGAGDEVLKAVAKIGNSTIRSYDLFARYGGEEFILLISNADKNAAKALTERIRMNICASPIDAEGVTISVSASFGVAQCSPIRNLEAAIRLADEALYRAKREGRNRVVFHEE